jgi:4-amino-4-deoxy-L-arabinose transferase-like glycosyltransferase
MDTAASFRNIIRERGLWLLMLLCGAAYLFQLDQLSLRGEEPRRIQVAFEMVHFQDYLVPREQGDPFLSRPPLHNWILVLSHQLLGGWGPWTARLPTVLIMFLTNMMIYVYARQILSTLGAFAAGLSFITCGEMLQTGRQAETEVTFIFLVSASMMLWHLGYLRGWASGWCWSIGYFFMALAGLCKGGLQPPIYFLGTTVGYLLLKRDWRFLFGRGHLIGISVAVATITSWLLPYYLQEGWIHAKATWMGDTNARLQNWRFGAFFKHFVEFPAETFGCLMPWSPLLLIFVRRAPRQWLQQHQTDALFILVAVGLAFPSCWLPPGGKTRYFAPLYPLISILIGLSIDYLQSANLPRPVRLYWFVYTRIILEIAFGIGCLVMMYSLISPSEISLLPASASIFGLLLMFVVVLGYWRIRREDVMGFLGCIGIISCLISVGLLAGYREKISNPVQEQVDAMRATLPTGVRLQSIEHVTSIFTRAWGEFIPPVHLEDAAATIPVGSYFCFDWSEKEPPEIPFEFEMLTRLSMERNRHPIWKASTVIAKRLR